MITFLPKGEYDHYPGVLYVHQEVGGKRPFKFFNMWVNGEGFLGMVKNGQ